MNDSHDPTTQSASAAARRSIQAEGFTRADSRILWQMASHARHGTRRDGRAWKVRPGECFSHAKARTIAVELGLADARTVRRAVRSAREAGILEVRQCDRTRRSYVWRLPQLGPQSRPKILAVSNSRTDQNVPRKRVLSTVVRMVVRSCQERGVRYPDLPATACQRRTISAMAKERGLSDPTRRIMSDEPEAALTRGYADDWIRYVKAQGWRVVKRVYRSGEPATDRQFALLRALG